MNFFLVFQTLRFALPDERDKWVREEIKIAWGIVSILLISEHVHTELIQMTLGLLLLGSDLIK